MHVQIIMVAALEKKLGINDLGFFTPQIKEMK